MGELVPSDAVRAIQDGVKTETIQVRGQEYITRNVYHPPYEPLPDTLTVHTLSGVAIFCNSFQKASIACIHVDHAGAVYVLGHLDDESQKRPCYLKAVLFREKQFHFGASCNQENFVIGLQTGFVETPNRQKLLQVAGAIETDQSVRLGDDGVSQKVATKQGVSLSNETEFKNPVWLAPYRTFPEIPQPESPYIFRVTGDGLLALHETLETDWQLKAINSIKEFLAGKVPDVVILH